MEIFDTGFRLLVMGGGGRGDKLRKNRGGVFLKIGGYLKGAGGPRGGPGGVPGGPGPGGLNGSSALLVCSLRSMHRVPLFSLRLIYPLSILKIFPEREYPPFHNQLELYYVV